MELKVNLIAIVIATVVNFFLGFIWFAPLFGKIWAKEMGYDLNEKPDKKVMAKGMIFMVIGSFLFAFVFAHNIAAWLFVPGMKEMSPFSNALTAAIFTWLGFYFPGHLGATVWERKSWKLFAIDTGYSLVSLLVAALILTYWT
jgi:MFS family permease